MFDRQVKEHQRITREIEKGFFKHIQIVTIDVGAVGWAGESSGSESGKFEYDGNALIILPGWMRASDKKIFSSADNTGSSTVAKLFVFPNTKDAPGLPFSAIGDVNFGDFGSLCCTFRQFYVYVAVPDAGRFIHLAVLKGVNLYGFGSKYSQVIGSYEG
jgi:hypothetical protein